MPVPSCVYSLRLNTNSSEVFFNKSGFVKLSEMLYDFRSTTNEWEENNRILCVCPISDLYLLVLKWC